MKMIKDDGEVTAGVRLNFSTNEVKSSIIQLELTDMLIKWHCAVGPDNTKTGDFYQSTILFSTAFRCCITMAVVPSQR